MIPLKTSINLFSDHRGGGRCFLGEKSYSPFNIINEFIYGTYMSSGLPNIGYFIFSYVTHNVNSDMFSTKKFEIQTWKHQKDLYEHILLHLYK